MTSEDKRVGPEVTKVNVYEQSNFIEVAKLSVTFSITMFLSTCVLASKDNLDDWVSILIFMWTSSGLFGAAAMRMIDSFFDNQTEVEENKVQPLFSFLTFRERHFLSFDDRISDSRFLLFFAAWIFFCIAYYHLGLKIFSLVIGLDSLVLIFQAATQFVWQALLFVVVMVVLFLFSLFAMTYDALFVR